MSVQATRLAGAPAPSVLEMEGKNLDRLLDRTRESLHPRLGQCSDPADAAHAAESEFQHHCLTALLDLKAASIRTALGRVAAGNYGRCEACSAKISEGRLRAVPEAALCISCQRESEASHR